jgi:hypothetical protein
MPDLSSATGEVVALAIKAALAPLQAELAVLKALLPDVGALRERLAVVEARPPVPGPPGAPGADGLSCDELVASQDAEDDRVVTLGYRRGDVTKTIGTLRLSTPRYCGRYEAERAYLPGDQVTHAGALWHCHAPTRTRPGDTDDGWQLQVKRGDGR